jgi:hypothetical protein
MHYKVFHSGRTLSCLQLFDENTLAYLEEAAMTNKKIVLLTMIKIMLQINKLGCLSSLLPKYYISSVHRKVIHSGRMLHYLQMCDENTLAYLAALNDELKNY